MPRRSIVLFAGACAALALAIGLVTIFVVGTRGPAQNASLEATGQPLVGGDFTLVRQDGVTVDQSILDGKWSLVFFGFTHCPDFCPTTLGVLDQVQKQLGNDAKDLQIVFISVDPARDTVQMMQDYLSSEGFPKGVIGLTGSEEQVASAAKAYRAFYQKVGEDEAYTMNHSLTVYLMGPDGQFRTAIAHDLGPKRSVDLIRNEMAKG